MILRFGFALQMYPVIGFHNSLSNSSQKSHTQLQTVDLEVKVDSGSLCSSISKLPNTLSIPISRLFFQFKSLKLHN
jgi:hypothetical protein